ncbi:hypothetical protein HPB50_012876 [Hyalomma asiaticum]|uniref:Uncharacterized protein n=1 Tax=Hyalomma asiaticum TaxID=266040 RepID=A0ACB7TJ46_HYAAI|nr:hypothetical protein HPB50_012876 [Hyalomma asiaticum]
MRELQPTTRETHVYVAARGGEQLHLLRRPPPILLPFRQALKVIEKNCFTRAKFVVRENTGESEECADDCDSLLTEVLECQGSAEALHFESFRDLDSDVATSPDLTDSEIVAAVVPHEAEDDENDDDDGDDVEADPDPSPSLTAVADAVAVMRAFAEKKGLMAKKSIMKHCLAHIDCGQQPTSIAVIETMHYVTSVWAAVNLSTVQSCIVRIGFRNDGEEKTAMEAEELEAASCDPEEI